ncbi:vacuolar protein sorting-associated protein 45 homolog isoform X1 [Cannabis sativa]|uniref:vacuolar protein sorting-associated protein 45 homolog isoform X1 n=1 Tax=Cannabis sativa TaxID=3483 RepID=UPI0029CA98A2|nr:vacuolar protein sorting-associated protein 45 homolog isoform X1 [Cannabis sativa]XP_060962497.1 vacuolar protein sorting-associated protein 45 homolog isoform X1 [Cannabis sativa]
MVLISAARDYINWMLQDISGMKVLILDSHTVSIVSVVYSQSELLQKEVFLVELIESIAMSHVSSPWSLQILSMKILGHHNTDVMFWDVTEVDIPARKWSFRFQKDRNFSFVIGAC